MASSDDAEVRATAADITEGCPELGAVDFESITDDKASLAEAGSILSREEETNSKNSVAPCPAAASTSTY